MGMYCEICNCDTKYESNHFARYHLRNIHKMDNKTYYDLYLKENENDGNCGICGKDTTFRNLRIGYSKYCKYCSQRCEDKRKKISRSCKNRDYGEI